jgi:hypothetical protein
MNEPKKEKFVFLKKFFMIFGIISFVFVLLLIVLIVAIIFIKPYGIDITNLVKEPIESDYDHPSLTTKQEDVLKSVGIDPKDIPTEITSEQEKCAIEALGEDRANEIKSGDMPTITEILKLKGCLD